MEQRWDGEQLRLGMAGDLDLEESVPAKPVSIDLVESSDDSPRYAPPPSDADSSSDRAYLTDCLFTDAGVSELLMSVPDNYFTALLAH